MMHGLVNKRLFYLAHVLLAYVLFFLYHFLDISQINRLFKFFYFPLIRLYILWVQVFPKVSLPCWTLSSLDMNCFLIWRVVNRCFLLQDLNELLQLVSHSLPQLLYFIMLFARSLYFLFRQAMRHLVVPIHLSLELGHTLLDIWLKLTPTSEFARTRNVIRVRLGLGSMRHNLELV